MSEEDIPLPRQSATVVPNCKVCAHPDRAAIDEMLLLGMSYGSVLMNLAEKAGDLNEKNLSNHKRKHIDMHSVPEFIPASVTQHLAESRDRVFSLELENQRLRAENMIADVKLRKTQQAAICLMIIDQLPNCLDQVTPKDVLAANKQLMEIMGDNVQRHEIQLDIVADLGIEPEELKALGDLLGNAKRIKR